MDSAEQWNAVPLILGREPHSEVLPEKESGGNRGIVLSSAAWEEHRTNAVLPVAEFHLRPRGAPPRGLNEKSPSIPAHPIAQQVALAGVGVVVHVVPDRKSTRLNSSHLG